MTIINADLIEDHEQADGSRHIWFRFTFHNGLIIDKRPHVASGWDEVAGLAAMIPVVEQEVIDNEDRQMLADVEQGNANPVTVIPIHPEAETDTNRQKRWLRKLVRWTMRNRDKDSVYIALYPVWYEFKFVQAYSIAQIASILDLTIAQVNKFNQRLQLYHDNEDLFLSDFIKEIE